MRSVFSKAVAAPACLRQIKAILGVRRGQFSGTGIVAGGRNSVAPVFVAFKTPIICRVCHLANTG